MAIININDDVFDMAMSLQIHRIAKKMTKKALAKASGIETATLSNWESGVHKVNVNAIPGLCKGLGITPNELFGFVAEKKESFDFEGDKPTLNPALRMVAKSG